MLFPQRPWPRLSRLSLRALRRFCATLVLALLPAVAAQAQGGLVQRLGELEELTGRLGRLMEESARQADGRAQDLAALRNRIAALEQTLRTQAQQEIGRMAHLLCGSVNADAGIVRRGAKDAKPPGWDYGRAYRISTPQTCDAFCKTRENGACDGMIRIHANQESMTADSCAHRPEAEFFSNEDHVFCCCR